MKIKVSAAVLALALAAVCGGCEQEFSLRRVSPAVGVVGGGEPVDIIGTGFQPGMGISVYFGTVRAEQIIVRGNDRITVNTPRSPEAMMVDVRVVTDDGREFLMRDAFRYIVKGTMDIRELGQRRSLRESQ